MKRQLFLALFCLAPLIAGCPPETDPTSGALRFANMTSYSATALYASPSTSTDWGDSVLSSNVASGFSRTITGIPPSTQYDFRAVFSNGGYAETYQVVFDAGQTLRWELTDNDLTGGSNVSQDILSKEMEAFNLVNNERNSNSTPVAALTMREDLRAVARAHSEDMIANNFFDHTNLDGETPFDRLHNAGVNYTTAGENIAWNAGYGASTASAAVDGWMNSSGHRANILNGAFTHTGMGVATGGAGKYMYTQVFIHPAKNGGGRVHLKSWAIDTAAETVN